MSSMERFHCTCRTLSRHTSNNLKPLSTASQYADHCVTVDVHGGVMRVHCIDHACQCFPGNALCVRFLCRYCCLTCHLKFTGPAMQDYCMVIIMCSVVFDNRNNRHSATMQLTQYYGHIYIYCNSRHAIIIICYYLIIII